MTINQLINALQRLVKEDGYRKGMSVVFSSEDGDPIAIEGGIIQRGSNGLAGLVLAPIKLDKVGGF